ncbi:YigZ family protein [Sphingobacteriaceae bacterium]|nr:YigZ family protein [Sphingobacteriaceae bacterium]
MLFSDSYFTIVAPVEAITKERGSKFLAFAFPVKTEPEIKTCLATLRKEHPSANHHCYAWRLGADKAAYRSNDDGEPSNSAGKPILAQIQSHDLTNILIVVVRYFGGTLLGVSGLINAYKNAASEALALASVTEQFILFEYKIEFGFDALSAVMRLLKEYDAKMSSTTYDEKNTIIFQVKKMHSEKLESKFTELYTTKLEFVKLV